MLKHYETHLMHPSSSLRAFQMYQKHGKRHRSLGDFNMINKQNKQKYFPSEIDVIILKCQVRSQDEGIIGVRAYTRL